MRVLKHKSTTCLSACFLAGHALLAQSARPTQAVRQLTVQPRVMATGTRTTQAGEHTLDSLPGYLVYVPARAVGTRRVPLVVSLAGGGISSRETMDLERPLADKYGWILFAPDISDQVLDETQVAQLDAGLKQILRTYAIDPEKIALTGMSNGGYAVLDLGCQNLAIFSAIAPLSPDPALPVACTDTSRPSAQRTPFYLSFGIGEPNAFATGTFAIASQLRKDGHPTQVALELRLHARRLQDKDQVWQWFQRSWTPGARLTPTTVVTAKDVPRLTQEVLTKMTTFWTRFWQEPESIRRASMQYRKNLVMPVGTEQVSRYAMLDMPALAAHVSAVAADLTRAGLTPQQEEGYRLALLSARTSQVARTSWHHKKSNVFTFDLAALMSGSGGIKTPSTNTSPVVATVVDSAQHLTTVPRLRENLNFLIAHESAVNALLDLMKVPRCETTAQMNYGGC
jgi:predicted esterase